MVEASPFYLLVGLGNPGAAYKKTRHNVGFRALEKMASNLGSTFRRVSSFHGSIAEGVLGDKKILLLMPETYMNSSGEAVRACVSYYSIPLTQVCAICDDIYLPFGRLRMKAGGSSGGHNGLKSIVSHLGTQDYPRLRIGVGDREEGDLADHVLSPFAPEEEAQLPQLLQKASEALECWVVKGIVPAMQFANVCQEEEEKPEKNLGE